MSEIRVQDVIDGDISEQVQLITETTIPTTGAGDYPIHMFVANRSGDTVDLPVTLSLYSPSDKAQAPTITLKDYLIYVARDSQAIDAMAYVEKVKIKTREWKWNQGKHTFALLPDDNGMIRDLSENEKALEASDLSVTNPVDTSLPGVYEIIYQLRDYADNIASRVRLIVVVEE